MTDIAADIDARPAREIRVGSSGQSARPVTLTIGVTGRDGRAGVAHGVLLTHDGALALMADLADELGVPRVRSTRSLRRRVLQWLFRLVASGRVRRDLRSALSTPDEAVLLRRIFNGQIPAQRTVPAHTARDGGTG